VEDGLEFWGGSCVVDPTGAIVAEAPRKEEALLVADIEVAAARRRRRQLPLLKDARLGLLARELERLIAEGGNA
ncbi:MAG: nitrilase-related carbon-nitrogen hydrolase, partial [Jatrophihabitantaceae bacterium]